MKTISGEWQEEHTLETEERHGRPHASKSPLSPSPRERVSGWGPAGERSLTCPCSQGGRPGRAFLNLEYVSPQVDEPLRRLCGWSRAILRAVMDAEPGVMTCRAIPALRAQRLPCRQDWPGDPSTHPTSRLSTRRLQIWGKRKKTAQ